MPNGDRSTGRFGWGGSLSVLSRWLSRAWGEFLIMALAGTVLVLAGCRQQAKPPPPAPKTQPAATAPAPPQTMPVQEIPQPQATTSQPEEQPRRFVVSEPGELLPNPTLSGNSPLAILLKIDPHNPATIRAILQSDSVLTINTDNVQALRLDLLNLPRQQAGRLILHLDGQGMEITGKSNQIIYLQRSSVGEWSFGRPGNR